MVCWKCTTFWPTAWCSSVVTKTSRWGRGRLDDCWSTCAISSSAHVRDTAPAARMSMPQCRSIFVHTVATPRLDSVSCRYVAQQAWRHLLLCMGRGKASRERKCADTIGTVLYGSLSWPFPVLKYKYFLHLKYTEAIIPNSTRKSW